MKGESWDLVLYVVGMTATAKIALANITAISEEHVKGDYTLEVIDLRERPELGDRDQIFGVPTLVRRAPKPLRKLIGDLSDHKKVLAGLEMSLAIA